MGVLVRLPALHRDHRLPSSFPPILLDPVLVDVDSRRHNRECDKERARVSKNYRASPKERIAPTRLSRIAGI